MKYKLFATVLFIFSFVLSSFSHGFIVLFPDGKYTDGVLTKDNQIYLKSGKSDIKLVYSNSRCGIKDQYTLYLNRWNIDECYYPKYENTLFIIYVVDKDIERVWEVYQYDMSSMKQKDKI